jgi:iron complex outermembrane receptor protein
MSSHVRGAVALAFACCAGDAAAQASSNAVRNADDAFGASTWGESIGIYDEFSVRGFSLEAAGNYRINGRYFVRNSGLNQYFIERSDVRIGYNTLGLDFPGPSGVFDYRLRNPGPKSRSSINFGIELNEQPFVELFGQYGQDDGKLSGSIGGRVTPNTRDDQGGRGEDKGVGGTLRFAPNDDVRAQVFFGGYNYRRAGRFGIQLPVAATRLPEEIERGEYLGQRWADSAGYRRITGGILELGGDDGWRGGASLFYSAESPTLAFNQLYQMTGVGENARTLVFASPERPSRSYSGEVNFGWRGKIGATEHDVSAHVRLRDSTGRRGGDLPIDAGTVVLGNRGVDLPAPNVSVLRATLRDDITQNGIGLSWQGRNDTWRWNLGVLRTNYEKRFTAADGSSSRREANPTLYNAGLAWRANDRFELYGSLSRGLEEAGVAPTAAANRNEVLEAVIAKQRELGVRYAINKRMNMIVAGFQTEKSLATLDPVSGVFGVTGDVRHRGVEFSVTGRPIDRLTVVFGGVYTDAEVAGPRVSLGLAGDRPVGVPKSRVVAIADYAPAWANGLSFDVGVQHLGRQAARSALTPSGEQLELPTTTLVDVGMRYRFGGPRGRWSVRAQVRNLFDTFNWTVNAAETLSYQQQQTYRVVFTREFDCCGGTRGP